MWAVDAIETTPTSAYSAAQAGRHALTKNLAIELAADRIRVNTVALAFVETPAYRRFMDEDEARAVLDAVNGFHPLGRRGQPGDVVEAILFLAGQGAGWITGTVLPVDGGVLAGRAPAAPAAAEAVAAAGQRRRGEAAGPVAAPLRRQRVARLGAAGLALVEGGAG